MENNRSDFVQSSGTEKLNQHVKIDMGSTYCIISCSKHRMSDLVSVIDSLVEKGWSITSGLTSDDGLVFQALTKVPNNEKFSNNKKGV